MDPAAVAAEPSPARPLDVHPALNVSDASDGALPDGTVDVPPEHPPLLADAGAGKWVDPVPDVPEQVAALTQPVLPEVVAPCIPAVVPSAAQSTGVAVAAAAADAPIAKAECPDVLLPGPVAAPPVLAGGSAHLQRAWPQYPIVVPLWRARVPLSWFLPPRRPGPWALPVSARAVAA